MKMTVDEQNEWKGNIGISDSSSDCSGVNDDDEFGFHSFTNEHRLAVMDGLLHTNERRLL
jgi:hypothetical protein